MLDVSTVLLSAKLNALAEIFGGKSRFQCAMGAIYKKEFCAINAALTHSPEAFQGLLANKLHES